MKRIIASCLLAVAAGCTLADSINVEKFQPPITVTTAPTRVHTWGIDQHVKMTNLAPFRPIVPAYNGIGSLLASWNPRSDKPGNHLTFIIIHGGHSVSPGNFASAVWLSQEYDANVLILDSFWSRGVDNNWNALGRMGANMRMLDALAAAKYTKHLGADPQKTILFGDSQGGWGTLRTFTTHEKQAEVTSLYKAGIALYPFCYTALWNDTAPPLGPYSAPLLVFTGGNDKATPLSECSIPKSFKTAEKWVHFEDATHAWDVANRGAWNPPIDGQCDMAQNNVRPFSICRSNKYTQMMRDEIRAFLSKHVPVPSSAPKAMLVVQRPALSVKEIASMLPPPEPEDAEADRRTQELLEGLRTRRP